MFYPDDIYVHTLYTNVCFLQIFYRKRVFSPCKHNVTVMIMKSEEEECYSTI